MRVEGRRRRRDERGFAGEDKTVGAADYSGVWGAAAGDGGAGAWEAGVTFGYLGGANFREAYRARSNSEFVAKLGVCLPELEETTYWLELLCDAEIMTQTQLAELLDECNQLIAIFTTISKNRKKTT